MVRRSAARPDRDRALACRRRSGTGADYLYTYLRTYYRDDTKATGWNNLVFPSVGMPHVLWELQGQRNAKFVEREGPARPIEDVHVFAGYEQISARHADAGPVRRRRGRPGRLPAWMGEPAQNQRVRLGRVGADLPGLFTVIAWRLNAAFWKDVK